MNHSLTTALILLIAGACSSPEQHPTPNSSSVNPEPATASIVAPKIYGIEGEDIVIREGPGKKYNKLVNQKATDILKSTQYCQLDYTTKVEILEEKDNWAKIRVVDPEWLRDSHVGWIPSTAIVRTDHPEPDLTPVSEKDFEVLTTRHNNAVENFHVLLKHKKFDKMSVHRFEQQFRKQQCSRNCNILVYDSKSIADLIDVYPLPDKDYLKLADHLMSISSFDAVEVRDWYPYQDIKYKELGGKKWKKKPIE